jgi:hypothetical protein
VPSCLPPCANPLTDPSWDRRVTAFPGASFFHRTAWARVLHDTYGFTPFYLIRESGGTLQGVLPFMEVDSWLTGRRGIALPFTDHCAPLGDDADIARLVPAVTQLAQARRWKHWELRGGTNALPAPPAVAFHGHVIDLYGDTESRFARCDSAVRRAVRKADSSGVEIEFSASEESVRIFYRLLCQTRRRHGLPPQPFSFFANIHRHVLQAGQGCIALAYCQGRPAAGAVFFHSGSTALFKFGASDETFQALRPNNLVMWRAIEWHARAGFTQLDLGRTSLPNPGLRRFKLSWGAAEHPILYARFDCQAGTFVTVTDRSTGWHGNVFKRVPSSLARLVGAVAYRHVA